MNAQTRINSKLDVRGQFPAIAGWHYLDSAATAQKPQAVIHAITTADSRDYATGHRGGYEHSGTMAGSDQTARPGAANMIRGRPRQLGFPRRAPQPPPLVP